MTPELKAEIESRVNTQLESQGEWEEDETRTQEEMEIVALEDIVSLDRDCGGLFTAGISPTFNGSAEWVASMQRQQAEHAREMERQHKEWLKLWREAKRELKDRRAG